MRPTGFASDDPEDITPSHGDDFRRWQWRLTCADGTECHATVEIERHLAEAWSYREYRYDDILVAAARSKGRSLLERRVIDQDDPPLDWFVGRETYGPKPVPPETGL
jgi:hypothetical protein